LPQMFSIYNGATVDLCHPDTGFSFDPLDQENFKSALLKAIRSPLERVPVEHIRRVSDFYSAECQGQRAARSLMLTIGS
jgi:hypothetical protein